jgi:dephospho-CoA kinase
MHVVGITGGIGSGKSTVTKILEDINKSVVIDADKLGWAAYQKGTSCYIKVKDHFGLINKDIISEDGEINRKILGSIVFSDKSKMKELESIVWPEIKDMIIKRIEELKTECKIDMIVIEAAIMIEAGWQDLLDMLWVIYVDREVAIERIKQRNSLSQDEAAKRVDSQMSNEDRLKYSNYSINNIDLNLLPSLVQEGVEKLIRK